MCLGWLRARVLSEGVNGAARRGVGWISECGVNVAARRDAMETH
jgi:hypothetical protein